MDGHSDEEDTAGSRSGRKWDSRHSSLENSIRESTNHIEPKQQPRPTRSDRITICPWSRRQEKELSNDGWRCDPSPPQPLHPIWTNSILTPWFNGNYSSCEWRQHLTDEKKALNRHCEDAGRWDVRKYIRFYVTRRTINSLKENLGIFKPGPYVYIFGCVNDLYLPKVLESVQEIVPADSHDTAAT